MTNPSLLSQMGSMSSTLQLGIPSNAPIVLRINVPCLKLQKAIKVNTSDSVWMLKKQLIDKFGGDSKDCWNFGIFLHGKEGKQGKFLDERKDLATYGIDGTSQVDFTLKIRLNSEQDSKKQKKLLEDVRNGNIERAKEKIAKNFETNFWTDTQESLLAVAVMNNDREMISLLVENGAYLDYRNGDKDGWKTPLHIAAINNKNISLKTLLEFGAWSNAVDTVGLTPIYYAATAGYSECVLRLLMSKADTEIYDESGKGPLHQAALNNFDCIVAMLIDFGASMHAVNVAGNTPLHVAATRNSKESTKWLLLRGAPRDRRNKTNKTPQEAAIQANCPETANIIHKFTDDQIVPPPPSGGIEGDTTAIINNILASIGASIGGEYKPQPYVGKPAHLRMQSQPVSSLFQNTHPHTTSAPVISQIQPTQYIAPTQTQSPLLPRRQPSNMSESDLFLESRKSVRKSIAMPPPPLRNRLSIISASGLDVASLIRPSSHLAEIHNIDSSPNSDEKDFQLLEPSVESQLDEGLSESSNSLGPLQILSDHPSQSKVDLYESANSIPTSYGKSFDDNHGDTLSGWSVGNSQTLNLTKPRSRPTSLLQVKRSATTQGISVADSASQQSILFSHYVSTQAIPETYTQPEVLNVLKRMFGKNVIQSNASIGTGNTLQPNISAIIDGVDELESTLMQTLKSMRQLEASNKRLREELSQTRG
ncbi:hypothetical protein BDV3_000166 [Batrachochytrium dendrobatidis]|uniref:Talin N-terminal F0 domain-containing protein n=2 Tax=Batrachochytrium dendrobatidis TaxID=109871 RepID=A0A177WAI4_BATDL|nr:hypothetical protein O5D80_004458 [Batrachochytrium dendrobatidis]KAK5668057.1 hypothetical protein QVD99_005098 [Batrachochytrium dendrobatidis]OAJ37118.1 hypothetical protein BDEG_21183 [Batrachochytrium dendrobatidis JEL423]